MHWPIQPLESQRRFAPQSCPRPDCPEHTRRSRRGFAYRRYGSYRRADGRRVPRFRCSACGHKFSKQSFAFSYYLKRPELSIPIAAGLQAGSAHRQLARSLGCAPSTVTRRAARLGRHSMLLLVSALRGLENLDEPVVLDHFETFEFTQDFPFGIATPVGHTSGFVYGLDPAPHARTGVRSEAQEARLKSRPRRSPRGGYSGSCRRVAELLLEIPRNSRCLVLISDGHKAYRSVLERNPFQDAIHHACYPNPKRGPKGSPRSKEAVARDRAMGPSDHLHRFLRHSLAHHRRETIAFGRRLNALMERMFLAAAWKNFVKGISERQPRKPTPAMAVGLTTKPWSWARVLARRLFPKRERVPQVWMELYRREWTTPVLPINTRHALVQAF